MSLSSIASSRRVGRFQLQDLVGQGAQSVVWRAWDPRLDRIVALKLHRAQASGGEAVEEWLHEARAVSRLSHAGIVPLFEADVHEQHPYLVFEFVEGRTLWHALREQGAWVPGEAVDLMICVLEALAHAHEAGVVHRLVNSASFRGHGAGAISTVSRAAALIGFAGIRNLALSLVLLEHMQDRAQAGALKEEFLRALMAGTVAAQLGQAARDAEESFIAAVFQNLGRLLAEFYFPEEARQIRQRVQAASAPGALEREAAAVLGLSYEELGVGVARAWGLPEGLQRAMRKLADEPPSRSAHDPGHAIRCVASLANEATDILLHTPPKEAPERLQALANRYAPALGIDARALSHAVQATREEMASLAPALKLQLRPAHRPPACCRRGPPRSRSTRIRCRPCSSTRSCAASRHRPKTPPRCSRPGFRTSRTPWSRTSASIRCCG